MKESFELEGSFLKESKGTLLLKKAFGLIEILCRMHNSLLFTDHVLNGSLEFELPVIDSLNALAEFLSDVGLGSIRLLGRAVNQFFGLFS